MLRDGDVREDRTLAPADRAVKYVLDRIQHDADLRWILLGTQAMGLLVEAEASRLTKETEVVAAERETWKGPGVPRPRIPHYRQLLDDNDIAYD